MAESGCLRDLKVQNLDVDGGVNVSSGEFNVGALKVSSVTTTTGTIAVTAGENYDVTFTQPANSYIRDLILIPAGNIVTADNDGDDVDISLGTTAGGTQLFGAVALLDEGGAAVTWTANTPLAVISNGVGAEANSLVRAGGPATNEAVTLAAGGTFSATSRTLHSRITPLQNDLTTAATTVKYIVVFQHTSV